MDNEIKNYRMSKERRSEIIDNLKKERLRKQNFLIEQSHSKESLGEDPLDIPKDILTKISQYYIGPQSKSITICSSPSKNTGILTPNSKSKLINKKFEKYQSSRGKYEVDLRSNYNVISLQLKTV